jgi:hypothetical protein
MCGITLPTKAASTYIVICQLYASYIEIEDRTRDIVIIVSGITLRTLHTCIVYPEGVLPLKSNNVVFKILYVA